MRELCERMLYWALQILLVCDSESVKNVKLYKRVTFLPQHISLFGSCLRRDFVRYLSIFIGTYKNLTLPCDFNQKLEYFLTVVCVSNQSQSSEILAQRMMLHRHRAGLMFPFHTEKVPNNLLMGLCYSKSRKSTLRYALNVECSGAKKCFLCGKVHQDFPSEKPLVIFSTNNFLITKRTMQVQEK